MTLTERIKAAIAATDSMVCVGMDVDPAKMPQHIERGADGIVAFVREIAESSIKAGFETFVHYVGGAPLDLNAAQHERW